MTMNQFDALSAKEGNVYFTIDGKQYEMAELISLNAFLEFETAKVATMGSRMVGEKIVGGAGTGKVKMYFHRPEFKDIAIDYIKTGKYPRIDIRAINEDKTSRAGRQVMLYKNCIFKKMMLSNIDAESNEVLTEETDFTFQSVEKLSSFKVIED
ncbi:Phage tail tube protein [Granulicatella balaenopterae]|uniref:Phage tail tube protein n=1 Tax=Granulicatella balaenopterae TaxID=137733 RepID=A0A1H9IL81_9LACT|nr:phage tail tube protein [Granulicatella balaenopterae]SEQ75297.1 Phage tail tube protein [Granulicatella balaenopterae]